MNGGDAAAACEDVSVTDRLMLLDTASLYFRAFYGVPDKVRAPDGTPINAVRGLLDIITKLVTTYRPTSVIACWDDAWRPTWRTALVPSYKEHRVIGTAADGTSIEDVPENLTAQLPIIREMLASLDIPVIGAADFEADDVIGTLAAHATVPVDVVTGDRDLFQVVDDARGVRVIYTAKGMSNLEVVTDEVLVGKYGVHADQYADFATMRGDASDGLPGVAGIGEKTAANLLAQHGTLSGVITAAEQGAGMTAGVQKKLLAGAVYMEVAPAVVAVARDVPVTAPGETLARPADPGAAEGLAERYGYTTTLKKYLAAL